MVHTASVFWRAAEFFERFVATYPNAAMAWVNLAVRYRRLKQREKTAQAIKKAMSLDPFNHTAQHHYDMLGPETLHSSNPTEASAENR